jgi:hypothetical protein
VRGQGFDAAFAPLAADLADLFCKWSYVRDRLILAPDKALGL